MLMYLLALAIVAQSPQPQRAPRAAALEKTLAIQVALDRAGFSSGVIDGRMGANTKRALEAYRRQHGGEPEVSANPVVEYAITPEDAAGPFTPDIPRDLVQQSKLPALGYRSIEESLAERFHSSAKLLQELNPAATFAAGQTILVPNVEPFLPPTAPKDTNGKKPQARAVGTSGAAGPVITVSRSERSLTLTREDGAIALFAPVTTGSENDPLPLGEWKVTSIHLNPRFHYNPDLFWDADPKHSKATLPAGPNGPVGVVWIDITKEHYGIHGSPEPEQIGRTESHGCVRLTNWDAARLAALATPGTRVLFVQ